MQNTFLLARTPWVSCINEPGQSLTQMAVGGRWDGEVRVQASHALRGCVAETPWAVLADLSRLDDPAGDSAPTWQTAARYAAENKTPTRVIVCAPPPQVRTRLAAEAAPYPTAVADSVDAARLLLGPFPGWNHRHFHPALPPQRRAVVEARTLAGEACVAFRMAHLIHPARLIVSELAGNAVEHARTDFEVQVSVRGPLLHLAVRDREPRLPHLIETKPTRDLSIPAGSGLRLIAAAATAWGALPCPGGKVVWATLAIDGRPTP